MLEQASDFVAESEVLYRAVSGVADADLRQETQFKGWSIEDVLVHLHFWNKVVDLSLRDLETFTQLVDGAMRSLQEVGSLRSFENKEITERGAGLREVWIAHVRDMQPRWEAVDPKLRLPWVGPSMSARSAMTARQMETWAHGMEVCDALSITRVDTDRIRNIVVLGVNTFGWAHQVHNLDIPEKMPALTLTAPSGEIWEFGDKDAGRIEGDAVDFAAVVTQTRAVADTGLQVTGDVARRWMAHAQCFAGPPETPPKPGSRRLRKTGR